MQQVLRYFHLDPKKSVQSSSTQQIITLMSLSISNNTQALGDKQNTIPGKSLSSNDFTDYYKNKLNGIEEEAEVNVQANWDENDSTADSYIQNKPGIDTVVTEDSNNLITSGAVFNAIDELPEPMIFKGSLGTGGTIQVLPAADNTNVGYTYKVITAGTYDGKTAKPGDTYISDGTEWILIPSGDEPNGTVTNVAMTVPTGLSVSGSPITTSGTLAITYAVGYAIPTLTDQATWTAKQDAISDLSTIRSRADEGHTAYGWGNHANAGYLMAISDLATIRSRADEGHAAYGWGDHSLAGYQAAISDLATIRSRSDEGHTAYGWGDHSQAGYVKSSGVTSVKMTVPTGLSISGSPITSTGTLALSFANGYSIPTTTKLSNWDTAYGWGNHANAGYIKSYVNTTYKLKLNNTTKGDSTNGVDLGTFYAPTSSGTGFLKGTKSGDDITWSWDNSTYNNYSLPLAASNTRGGVKIGFTTNATNRNYAVLLSNELMYVNVPWTDHYAWSDITGKPSSYYTLPLAANGTRGGVLIGYTTDATNKNYAVLLSSEKMYVNVPWTDNNTTYTIATGDSNGQIKVTPSSGNAYNVDVKGLGSAAYLNADTSATANTVVKRDANKYIYGTYFNSSISNEDINSYTNDPAIMFTSNDKWIRRTTKANLLTWLGLGSRAYDSTSYLPLDGGTMTGTPYINMPAKSATIADSQPFGITYGRIQCYGSLLIAADTDGSTTEYVNITSGYGISNATAANGLSIGYTTLKWKGENIWHAGNDGSGSGLDADLLDGKHASEFATSGHTHSYLPLSGGTMTGNISFANSGTGFRGINYGTMGDNDQWRIGGAATAANAGYMEISTADNGTEPIYVRQYTGVFITLTRTLTLLDGSGNTTFPGNLFIDTGDNDRYIHFRYNTNNYAGASWRLISRGSGSGDTNYFDIETGGSTASANTWYRVIRLTMDNRYVGIGTDSPAYKLDVNGTVRLSGIKFSHSAGATMNEFGDIQLTADASTTNWNIKNKSGSILLLAHANGNVGIGGVNPPLYKLHVNGDVGATDLYIGENRFTTTSNYLTIACKSNEVVLAGDASTMYFNYRTYTGKTIPTTFKWNAGASNAWAAHDMGSLTVRGTVDIYPTGSRSSTGVLISHANSFDGPQIVLDPLCTDAAIGTGSDYSAIALSKTAGTMYIRYPAGKTLSVGPFNLSTAYGYFNSSGGWTGPSDASLKKDIYKPSKTESHNIWEWLVEKGFKRFTWINTEKHDIGAIAQEVLEILPEVVDYNESTKLYGLDYTKLHSHAISSIVQELKDTKEEIKLLQALIAELKLLLNN